MYPAYPSDKPLAVVIYNAIRDKLLMVSNPDARISQLYDDLVRRASGPHQIFGSQQIYRRSSAEQQSNADVMASKSLLDLQLGWQLSASEQTQYIAFYVQGVDQAPWQMLAGCAIAYDAYPPEFFSKQCIKSNFFISHLKRRPDLTLDVSEFDIRVNLLQWRESKELAVSVPGSVNTQQHLSDQGWRMQTVGCSNPLLQAMTFVDQKFYDPDDPGNQDIMTPDALAEAWQMELAALESRLEKKIQILKGEPSAAVRPYLNILNTAHEACPKDVTASQFYEHIGESNGEHLYERYSARLNTFSVLTHCSLTFIENPYDFSHVHLFMRKLTECTDRYDTASQAEFAYFQNMLIQLFDSYEVTLRAVQIELADNQDLDKLISLWIEYHGAAKVMLESALSQKTISDKYDVTEGGDIAKLVDLFFLINHYSQALKNPSNREAHLQLMTYLNAVMFQPDYDVKPVALNGVYNLVYDLNVRLRSDFDLPSIAKQSSLAGKSMMPVLDLANENFILGQLAQLPAIDNKSERIQSYIKLLERLFIKGQATQSILNQVKKRLRSETVLTKDESLLLILMIESVNAKALRDKTSDPLGRHSAAMNVLLLLNEADDLPAFWLRHDSFDAVDKILDGLPEDLLSPDIHTLVRKTLHDKLRQSLLEGLNDFIITDKDLFTRLNNSIRINYLAHYTHSSSSMFHSRTHLATGLCALVTRLSAGGVTGEKALLMVKMIFVYTDLLPEQSEFRQILLSWLDATASELLNFFRAGKPALTKLQDKAGVTHSIREKLSPIIGDWLVRYDADLKTQFSKHFDELERSLNTGTATGFISWMLDNKLFTSMDMARIVNQEIELIYEDAARP